MTTITRRIQRLETSMDEPKKPSQMPTQSAAQQNEKLRERVVAWFHGQSSGEYRLRDLGSTFGVSDITWFRERIINKIISRGDIDLSRVVRDSVTVRGLYRYQSHPLATDGLVLATSILPVTDAVLRSASAGLEDRMAEVGVRFQHQDYGSHRLCVQEDQFRAGKIFSARNVSGLFGLGLETRVVKAAMDKGNLRFRLPGRHHSRLTSINAVTDWLRGCGQAAEDRMMQGLDGPETPSEPLQAPQAAPEAPERPDGAPVDRQPLTALSTPGEVMEALEPLLPEARAIKKAIEARKDPFFYPLSDSWIDQSLSSLSDSGEDLLDDDVEDVPPGEDVVDPHPHGAEVTIEYQYQGDPSTIGQMVTARCSCGGQTIAPEGSASLEKHWATHEACVRPWPRKDLG